jgi:hypothetical protein
MLVDFTTARGIIPKFSPNNEDKFDPISQEVEDYYLPRILGRGFAYDVQKNPGSYTSLLEGVEFEDCNDETVKFKGLYYVLTYFIFAQYVGESKIEDSFTGFVEKSRTDATTSSQGQESTLKQSNRKYAESEVNVMKEYLNKANEADPEAYPLWDCSKPQKSKIYTPKFTPIKKTKS